MNNYGIFLIGFLGAIVVTATFPLVESAIPPTPAFKIVNSDDDNGNATATSFDSTLYVIGNGTKITNYLETPVGWCDQDYSYRKTITIDNTYVPNTDQTNFPFMYNVTDTDIETRAESDGDDIIFCDENHNQIPHDLDEWSDGQLLAWVNVPDVYEATDTDLYVYYDYDDVSGAQENEDDTWGAEYYLVYHFNNELADSSGNGNDATVDLGVECYLDNDGAFGTGYMSYTTGCPGYSRLKTTFGELIEYTDPIIVIMGIGQETSTGTWKHVFNVNRLSVPYFAIEVPNNDLRFILNTASDLIIVTEDTDLHNDPNHTFIYQYNATFYNSTDISIYRNGEQKALTVDIEGTISSDISDTTDDIFHGNPGQADRTFWSPVGEHQLILAEWTDDKLEAVVDNYYTPNTFYSTGIETINPSLGFVPEQGITISLSIPTSTVRGGVLATVCDGGDFVTGINTTDGGLLCDTP